MARVKRFCWIAALTCKLFYFFLRLQMKYSFDWFMKGFIYLYSNSLKCQVFSFCYLVCSSVFKPSPVSKLVYHCTNSNNSAARFYFMHHFSPSELIIMAPWHHCWGSVTLSFQGSVHSSFFHFLSLSLSAFCQHSELEGNKIKSLRIRAIF